MDQPTPEPRPDVLAYATPQPPDEMAHLRKYQSAVEAGLAKLKLEDEGIPATVAGESLAAGIGIYGEVSGQLVLMVRSADVPEARRILDEIEARRAHRVAAEEKQLQCPRCADQNSRAFGVKYFVFGLISIILALTMLSQSFLPPAAMLLLFAGVYFLVSSAWRRTCRKCGLNWTPKPAPDPDDE